MNGEPKVPFVQTGDQETEEVGYDLRPAPLRLLPRSRDAHAPRLSENHHSQQNMAPAEYGGEVKSSKISPACGLAAIVSKFEILEAMTNLEKPAISTTVTAGPRTSRKIPRHHSKHMMGEKMDPSLESSQFSSGDVSAPKRHNHSQERQWLPDTSTSTMVSTRSRDKEPSTAGGIATGSMHNIVAERRQIFEPRTGCHTMPSKSASMPFSLHGTSLSGSSPPLTMELRRSKTYWTTAMESDSLSEASKSQIGSQTGLRNTNNQDPAGAASINSGEQTAATVDVHAGGHDPLLMHRSEARREAESNTIGNAAAAYPNFRGTVMKTVQSRVTNLRSLFNMTAKEDDEPQPNLCLKRRHTGPQRNRSMNRSHAPINSFDYDREFRLGCMIDSPDSPRCLREYQSARVSRDSTRSSLKDDISAFESLSHSRLEISEPKRGTPSKLQLTPARNDEREEHSEKRPVSRRFEFESLGFKQGREVWRKLSASWNKRKPADDGLDKHEDRHGTIAASPGLPTTLRPQEGENTTGRRLGSWLPKMANSAQDETLISAASLNSTRAWQPDLPARKNMPAIAIEQDGEVAILKLKSVPCKEQLGNLPACTTGPIIERTGISAELPARPVCGSR